MYETLYIVILLLVCILALQNQHNADHPHVVLPRSNVPLGEEDASFWLNMAQERLAKNIAHTPTLGQAKNIILFMGDGLSIPTLTAARIFQGGEQHKLVFEEFPYSGLSKTYCVDAMVADSACSSTAYLGGVKGNLGTIGVTGAVHNKDCDAMKNVTNQVKSILWKAQQAGKSTGFVTTTRVTHASPAGTYAHTAERLWECDTDMLYDNVDPNICDDIAEQLVRGDTGRNLKVIFGGGRYNFRPNTQYDEEGQPGYRSDGVDLIAEWQQSKQSEGATWGWAWDRASLEAIDIANTDYIMGIFDSSHLEYQQFTNTTHKPDYLQMVRTAIEKLSSDPNGFVLFVEGGRIDTAHHETHAQLALDETLHFDAAIRLAMQMTSEADTLIVATADHAHTMSIAGYPQRGADILGFPGKSDVDNKPFSTLAYANGPGYKYPQSDSSRYDISNDNLRDPMYEMPALAPLSSETHGGDDVAVFARGPWSHFFTGTYEQHFIEHAMCYASCLGTGLSACNF